MIKPSHTPHQTSGPELAPLVDIVFLVVVFLLLTSNSRLISMPLSLPETEQQLDAASTKANHVAVVVHNSPPYWHITAADDRAQAFNDWPRFEQALLAHVTSPNSHLSIATETASQTDHLLRVLALLSAHDFNNIELLMEPSQ